MKREYINGKPALPVAFIGDRDSVEVIALMDSGADYCTLPPAMCRDIGLRRVGMKEVAIPGATMNFEEYVGKIEMNGSEFSDIEVLAVDLLTPEIDALIGRNILNRLKVELDGKDGLFLVQDP